MFKLKPSFTVSLPTKQIMFKLGLFWIKCFLLIYWVVLNDLYNRCWFSCGDCLCLSVRVTLGTGRRTEDLSKL